MIVNDDFFQHHGLSWVIPGLPKGQHNRGLYLTRDGMLNDRGFAKGYRMTHTVNTARGILNFHLYGRTVGCGKKDGLSWHLKFPGYAILSGGDMVGSYDTITQALRCAPADTAKYALSKL